MLPIESVLSELSAALQAHGVAVLQAPPGAGKTTRVPLHLLDALPAGQKLVMLEPRRIAARAAARFMAASLREPVGATVGYRVRLDTRVGPDTRIEVVTEGVLTRMLQRDPALEGIATVIFDEFHERSLHADLGLALSLQSRAILRPDLQLLVMSATLDGARVAALLGDDAPAPVIRCEGRAFAVETHHVPVRGTRGFDREAERRTVATIREALASHEGDVLVFLPGAGEIARVEQSLAAGPPLPPRTWVAPLHSALSPEQQDRAIAPSAAGERKVVLATNAAETSLTIERVRVVVDTGWMRVPRFDPRPGMTRLETVRVSRASADQRRGRAGRVGPGTCYRLWDAGEDHGLVPHRTPEILDADLAPLALELAQAGIADPGALRWLDAPPAAAFAQARELLRELGALDEHGRITAHGHALAGIAAHPRIGHMLLRASAWGAAAVACDLAALLADRDVLRGEPGAPPDADIRLRLELLHGLARGERLPATVHGLRVDPGALRRALTESRAWRRTLRVADDAPWELADAGALIALAWPDRIAQRRTAPAGAAGAPTGAPTAAARYLLRNGSGAELDARQPLAQLPWLAVAELGGIGAADRIFLAAPLELAEVEQRVGDQMERERVVEWDPTARTVRARERVRLGAIVVREAPLRDPEPTLAARALLDAVRREGLATLPWTDDTRSLRARLAFLHRLDPAWPDVGDDALLATLDDWLGPALAGISRLDEVRVGDALLHHLDWSQRARLDELAPAHLVVPSGSRIRVDYGDAAAPVLAVRLQELFGMRESPAVGGGRVPVVIHLLSPAMRPVQVTRDLAGFWRSGYFDVRKELKGRYPKHDWPDDPLTAAPRRGTRKP
ncbi:MAG: ATP-dependent helicase HrpB [Gemmatimonadaceae bacterium]